MNQPNKAAGNVPPAKKPATTTGKPTTPAPATRPGAAPAKPAAPKPGAPHKK